ncbi:MAG: ketopantoate reductase family protein [Bacteroidia bacterium]
MKRKRIAILGIGAVGGYLGALLAERYSGGSDVEVIFVARGKTAEIIREKGLKLITPSGEKIARPHLVTNDPDEIAHIDILICCVKSYDLEESLLSYKKCIDENTIIIPLLNGVDAKQRISTLFPGAEVWNGCVYIISRILEPGVIKESGNVHIFYLGNKDAEQEKPELVHRLFSDAGIDARLSEDIELTCWEKFIFISVVASATSYFDKAIGPILDEKNCLALVKQLLSEIKTVADAKGICFGFDIEEETIAKMKRMPYETTSSMHSDFQKGGKTELRSLTEYVVEAGKLLEIKLPGYEMVLDTLKRKKEK